MKIVIIGAGIGGLQAAKTLAEGGADVTVYEAKQYADLAYDWIDDVETAIFDELSIPLQKGVFHTADVTFAPPFSEKRLHVYVDESKRDWSIERRAFSQTLADRAIAAGVKIEYGIKVQSLQIIDNKVRGIMVCGKTVEADLVIDASGVYSPFRASLPSSAGVQAAPAAGEVFKAYRAFFAPTLNAPQPMDNKLIYLKHLGEDGISWCFVEPNGDLNVLIGRTDILTDDARERALTALRKDIPLISQKILRGDTTCTIPIRYPISKMVADGYAAVGDSAFMTIPMIGSGIANSLRAGEILAKVALDCKDFSTASLWEYQYRYFTQIGAAHVSVDMIKRMLLSAKGEDVRFLFERGIVSEVELQGIASGEKLEMSGAMIIDKVKRGWKKLGLLIKVASKIGKGEKAEAHARAIPKEYDESAVARWARKLDGFFA